MTDRYTFTVTMDADPDPMAWKPAEIRSRLAELVAPWWDHLGVDVKFHHDELIVGTLTASELLAPYMVLADKHDDGESA